MAKKRKKKKHKPIDPQKVAQGQVSVTPLELVRLIHAVNPTKRGYQKKKQAEQYRLKTELQSLLINQFADSLNLVLVEDPHLISLQLKHFDEDGCHALLSELDDAARSWAQMQIDLQTAPSSKSSRSQGKQTVNRSSSTETANDFHQLHESYSSTELLQMGRQALDEYDFEHSEQCFRSALDKKPDDPEAAVALLELYVDSLAAYEQAIELANRLPAQVKKESRVCGLTALAMARSGQVQEALSCLGKVISDRSPEVFLLAGFHFVEQEDAEQAAECHTRMRIDGFSDLSAEKTRLAEEIQQLRANQLKPVEDKMLAAWQEGKEEIAAQLADELLTRDKGNQQAKKIQNLFLTQQRREKIQQLSQEADTCRADQLYYREMTILHQIVDLLDRDDPEINKRLQQAIDNEIRQRQQQEVAEVVGLIRHGSLQTGLLQFTGLTEEQQQQVIKESSHACLQPLIRIIQSKSLFKPDKMVEAVMELDKAGTMLEQGDDAREILAVLQSRDRILHAVPEAIELRQRAEKLLRSQTRVRSLALLEELRQAVEQEKPGRLSNCVERIDETTLTPEESTGLHKLLNRLRLLEHTRMLKSRYSVEQNSNNFFAARTTARELARNDNREKKSDWLDKADQTTRMINREWRLTRLDVRDLPPCYRLYGHSMSLEQKHGGLMADGRHAVVVTDCGEWLLFYIMDIVEQEKQQVVLLHPPVHMPVEEVTLFENKIWVASTDGVLLQLSLEPLDIVFFHDYSTIPGDYEIPERVFLFPASNYLWLSSGRIAESDVTRVINIDKHLVERKINLDSTGVMFQRDGEEVLADSGFASGAVQMYSSRGRITGELPLNTLSIIDGVLMDMEAGEYIFLMSTDMDTDEIIQAFGGGKSGRDKDEKFACIARIAMDGTVIESHIIDDVQPEFIKMMHRGGRTGLIFTGSFTGETVFLQAWEKGDQGLRKLYTVPLPPWVIFVNDELSQELVMINTLSDGHQLFLLDRQPPECREKKGNPFLVDDIPDNTVLIHCKPPTGKMNATKLACIARMRSQEGLNPAEEVRRIKSDKNPDSILACIYALQSPEGSYRIGSDLNAWFIRHYPDHPYSKVQLAEDAIQGKNWTECVELLEGLLQEEVYDGLACHICHVLGLAYLGTGEPAKAKATWEKGLTYTKGICKLAPLINYADQALAIMGDNEGMAGVALPELLHLSIRVEDAFKRKAWLEVVETLEPYALHTIQDIQLLARFAGAFLHLETGADQVRKLGKIMTLAFFCQKLVKQEENEMETLFVPLVSSWPDTHLEELGERAEAWLGEYPIE